MTPIEELLFVVTGSVTVLLTVASFVRAVPLLTLVLMAATMSMTAELPADRLDKVSLTALPLLLRVKAGPLVWLCDTKVVPVGSVSARVTLVAVLGPALLMARMYVTSLPARAVLEPVRATPRLAWVCTLLACMIEVPKIENVVVDAAAESVSPVPELALEGTRARMEKLAEAPEGRVLMVSETEVALPLREKVDPLVCVCETKEVMEGSVLVRVTLAASKAVGLDRVRE